MGQNRTLWCAALMACLWTAGSLADDPVAPDPLIEAQSALKNADYPIALQYISDALSTKSQNLLSGASSEGRTAAAKDLLVQVTTKWTQDLEKQGQAIESARATAACVNVLGDDPRAADLKSHSTELLKVEFENAVKAHQSIAALRLASAAARLFPGQPALATPSTLKLLRLSALATNLRTARPEYLYHQYVLLKHDGVIPSLFQQNNIDGDKLFLNFVNDLLLRRWHLQAQSILVAELESDKLSPETRAKYQSLLQQARVSYADACLSLGNCPMIRGALDAFPSEFNALADATEFARLQSAFKKIDKVDPPVKIENGGFIAVDTQWEDSGTGHSLEGTVRIGNDVHESGGDKWVNANVEVLPGFVLDGGTIRPSKGRLILRGTAEKPIIFRNVKIECDYTAEVKAEYTLFEDCVFEKAGAWFWNDGYSSKWDFNHCLMHHSSFKRFNRIDFGIKWNACTFVACDFPNRTWMKGNGNHAAEDTTAYFRSEWNHVEDCDFYECNISVALTLTTQHCNFYLCREIHPFSFAGSVDLETSIGLPPEETDFYDQLKLSTGQLGKGKATFTRVAPYPRNAPSPMWKWTGDQSPPGEGG